MRPDVLVHDIGTEVQIGPGDETITGTVIQIAIAEHGKVQYQISWWSGRERKTEWLEAFEVVAGQPSVKIGFIKPA